MALTEKQRQDVLDVLERTSFRRRAGSNVTIPDYPQEYYDFLKLCEEEIIERLSDGYPYKIYIYRAKNRTENCPVHINIHGGGFIGPHAKCDSMYSAFLANKIQGIVVDLDYTTSQIAPYPVALNQCYDAAQYTFENCERWGADPKRVSMGGYSAGAELTAIIALKAGQTKDFQLCLQVLGYPPLDHVTHPLYKKEGYKRVLPAERELAFAELYFDGDTEAAASPLGGSPLNATDDMLAVLPRTLIISANGCNFRFENEEYAERLASVGVEVTVKRFMQSGHGFIPHFAEGWEEAADLIVRSIKSASLA